VLIPALVLLLAACGGTDSSPSPSAEQQQTSESATAATTAPDTIEVTMKDFAYEPDTLTIPAGQEITLQFTNTGAVEHYFVVGNTMAGDKDGFEQNLFRGVSLEKNKPAEGHDDEAHEEEEDDHPNEFELPPGGSGSITFTLPPEKAGTYRIACFETTGEQKHYEMGMKGALTVTASDTN
jgi:uncharacterized cupredoxin-like copper-binding protein